MSNFAGDAVVDEDEHERAREKAGEDETGDGEANDQNVSQSKDEYFGVENDPEEDN